MPKLTLNSSNTNDYDLIIYQTGGASAACFSILKAFTTLLFAHVHGHLHAKHICHIALKLIVIMAHKCVCKSNKK